MWLNPRDDEIHKLPTADIVQLLMFIPALILIRMNGILGTMTLLRIKNDRKVIFQRLATLLGIRRGEL